MATIALPTIKTQIKKKLESIANIEEHIYEYATVNFTGYPAAVIDFVQLESDVEDLKHNVRVYQFIIHLFYESEHTIRKDAERILQDLSEEVVDVFEGDEFLSGISLPAGKDVLWIRPSTSPIIKEDKWLICDVNLPIRVSFDVNS